ncbi:hypothetical protein PsorP6_002012 [Peronosclerospora sorghi]|uniref:Uncharacterized protein n=1 Tax=Peronosclerospora sorghi TaxID=230839 RepID=A0ACC0WYT0_9STRA|nr:hypothetical protein PsorP6_002012 [Peronosclerospora sorghi]
MRSRRKQKEQQHDEEETYSPPTEEDGELLLGVDTSTCHSDNNNVNDDRGIDRLYEALLANTSADDDGADAQEDPDNDKRRRQRQVLRNKRTPTLRLHLQLKQYKNW